MLFALLYPRLQPADATAVDALRARFEPERAALVPPHVTLVFGVRTIDPGDLVALCRSAATGQPPFPLAFVAAQASEDPVDGLHRVMLTVGEGARETTELHETLYAGPHRAEFRDDVPFEPHMTVATCATAQEARTALGEARRLALPFRATVADIAVERLESSNLRRVATIPLAGG